MLPPLPRCSSWAYSSLISPGRISLPRKGCRVGLHIVLFEACSAFTRVSACTLARSPIRDPLPEGFRHFVTSMPAPVASGWSESPGGACTHWKAPPCHGAHPYRPLLEATPSGNWVQLSKCIPQTILRGDEWYNDYAAKAGIGDIIGTRLFDSSSCTVILSVSSGDLPRAVNGHSNRIVARVV